MRIAGQQFVSMLRARPQRYNREAEELERLASHPPGQPSVSQVTVARERRLVDHLATDVKQIQECIRLGADAIASLVLDHVSARMLCAK